VSSLALFGSAVMSDVSPYAHQGGRPTVMRAGSLDRVIQFQQMTKGIDLYGAVIDVCTVFATMRAQKLENATGNRERDGGDTTDKIITFRMHWIDGLTNRLSFEGQDFKITRLKEIGRRIGLEVVCERVGS
jgi:head-tail adaptor